MNSNIVEGILSKSMKLRVYIPGAQRTLRLQQTCGNAFIITITNPSCSLLRILGMHSIHNY
jgi:hypothetical protein